MKYRSVPIGLILALALFIAFLFALTVVAVLSRYGSDIIVPSAAVLALAFGMLGYLLFTQLICQVDAIGIAIKKWGKVRYVLPWEEVRNIGMRKGYMERPVLYASRYDVEGTERLLAQILIYDDVESLPMTMNYAVSSKKRKEDIDKASILIVKYPACEADYTKLLSFYCRHLGRVAADHSRYTP